MGEVYRARDTRLNRTVAIKAMHESFAQDPERAARFEREAQLLASLNHPNIAAIYGVEEAQGSSFLVLEFIDGRPLSDILQAGAPPLAEAVAIATHIAAALSAAHERGIIHRDLKPGNVMVTGDGHVKVLDFGLGKSLEHESSHASDPSRPPAHSPTMTMAATQAGIILGTAGYMSPEQAKGRTADKRSDVWAFGCVLYELLTGTRAFDGEDVTEILAAIVRGEPEWQAIPAAVPASLRDLVRRCLIKNRAERLADMSVVQFVLSERASAASVPVPPAAAGPTSSSRAIGLPIVAGLMALAVIVTAGAMAFWPRGAAGVAAPGLVHLGMTLPDGDEMAGLNQLPMTISPDGKTIVYTATRDGKTLLFVRDLAGAEPRPVPGTDGAKSPFFSPNGEWVAFFAQGKLRKVTLSGAGLQDITEARDARGGAWSEDDAIYFAPTNVSGILKVSCLRRDGHRTHAPGSRQGRDQPSLAARAARRQGRPVQRLVRARAGRAADRGTVAGFGRTALPGQRRRHAALREPGYLLYGRLDGLFAVPWQPGQGDASGAVPITLPEGPRLDNEGGAAYGLSSNGTLVYVAGGPARLAQQIVWVDRAGKIERLPGPDREFESVALSPNGQQAAVQVQESVIGIWLYDFSRQTLTPFLSTGASSQAPQWTPDGKRLIYRGTRNGVRNLFMKSADGTGAEVQLTNKENVIHTPTSISPEGEWVIYNESGQVSKGGVAIWRMRIDGDRTPQPLLQDGESNGQVSPDGKWLAFQTAADRSAEVCVQPYPGPGPRKQVSIGGGGYPLWSHDGRELFYETADQIMAVEIKTAPEFSAGTPRVVVQGRYRASANGNTHYAASADGRRFLRIQRVQPERPVTHIDVVLNWFLRLTPPGQKSPK